MKTIVSLRNFLLLAAVVVVVSAIPLSEQLQFDQRIESFFADENPDLKILERSRRDFGGDEFVIVAWTEDRLFAIDDGAVYPDSLNDVLELDFMPEVAEEATDRIESLTEQLNAIPGVNAAQTQHLPGLLHKAPRYRAARRAMVRMFEGSLVGQDGRTTGVLLQLDTQAEAAIGRGETLQRIRDLAEEISAEVGEVAVAGEPVQVFDMFEIVEEDGQLLFLVSLVILATVLLLMFRGLRWVLAPVGLVLGTAIVTRAILVLVGAELSMVSSMMNSLVTVIGIATFMHVIVHYRDLRSAQALASPETESEQSGTAAFTDVAGQTLQDMAMPVFWTCVTTGVGFASLLVSQITPVRSFAIMMCLATGMVFIGCCMIMPATLASGSRLRNPAQVPMEHWLDRVLRITCHAVETRPLIAGFICAALFAASIPGVLRLEIETDFSKNFKDSSTIVQSLKFVERRLGGAGSWEISFDTPEETSEHYVLNDPFLAQVRRLTEALREMTGDDDSIRVLSLTDIGEIPPKRLFGTPTKTLARIRRLQPLMIENFYNQEARRMRIVLRSHEQQPSEQKARQIVAVRKCVRDFFEEERATQQQAIALQAANADSTDQPQAGEDAVIPAFQQETPPAASGMFVLLAELILSLLDDQLKSFLVACAGILLCVTIAFRSLRLGVISLFPNIFPVAVVMGALGWMGAPVNIGTAMITSVSMGLTVDSTIHYICAFERARRTTSVANALHIAHSGAGRAVVFAHLALVAGFLVLTASRFVPLVYFGALLSLSMIGGVFGDLVLLPLLLRWTTPETVITSDDVAAE